MSTASRTPLPAAPRPNPHLVRPTSTPRLARAASLAAILVVAAACNRPSGEGEDAIGPAVVAGQGAGAGATSTLDARAQRGSEPASPARGASSREPGRGVVVGRLIDSATGLPVPDVQIQLVESGRRTLTGASGTFRFDGVPPGELTVAFGPSDAHVVSSRRATVGGEGFDFGLVPLLAADAPTYVVAELGGRAPGCGLTEVDVPAGALDGPAALRVTCLPDPSVFPAPAPPGRLPLAVVDLAPGDRALAVPLTVTLALPAQPRFAPGVALELLQLDIHRLSWDPIGIATVDPGGETASGGVGRLAPIMVVAPPFGSVGAAGDTPPTIARYNVSAAADGQPADVFDSRTVLVYAGFEYAGMLNTIIRVKTTDAAGATVFESRRPYVDAGRDNVPMVAAATGGQAGWPVGRYLTTWSIGEPPVAVGKAVAWVVTDEPTPGPMAVALVIAPNLEREGVSVEAPYGADGPPPRAVPAGAADCGRPPGWVEYTVQRGDTLSRLAERSAVDVATLMRANCLPSDSIFAGQLLYMARFPSKPIDSGAWPPSAWPPIYPVKPGGGWPAPQPTSAAPPGGGGPTWPTKEPGAPATLAPLPYPTTWYTPPAPQAVTPQAGGWSAPAPGSASRGGAPAAPTAMPQPPAQPFLPPAAPTRIPPKDPSPAEPTLAPRPNP